MVFIMKSGWSFQSVRPRISLRRNSLVTRTFAVVLAGLIALAGCSNAQEGVPSTPTRGPGMQPNVALSLPVPRALDLSHVQPAHFADALGRDPERIFAYVRDNIAYEPYPGALRGARGTLLAMAGNGLDRAILLASLLERSGHRVRYVRGTLSAEAAAALVASVIPARVSRPQPTTGNDPSPLDTLHATIVRDYEALRSRLASAGASPPGAVIPNDILVREARTHFWVQIEQGGNWRDLDPSFAEASPGRAYAKAEQTFDQVPEELFHRITLRIRIEEQTESGAVSREVLTYSAPTPALSGEHVMLVHLPETWNGPQQAPSPDPLPAPGESNIKPVLSLGQEIMQGQAFRQVPEPSVDTRVRSLLRGSSVPTGVTAEWLDIELTGPDGRRETITRGIFDVVGMAQRGQRQGPASPVTLNRGEYVDLRGPIYDIFVTTGRIDPSHLPAPEEVKGEEVAPAEDVTPALRGLALSAVVTADALTGGLRGRTGTFVFYPDSPRIHIVELAGGGDSILISFDLRRDTMRLVAEQSGKEDAFFAHVFRGVLNGTLERALADQLLEGLGSGAVSHLNTSRLFERAHAENVPFILLPQEKDKLDASVPSEARARLDAELQRGFLVVVPARPLLIQGTARVAWWRINPQSGETVGVTDEGLHQSGTEKSGTDSGSFYVTRGASGGWWVHVTTASGRYGYARPFTLAWGDTLGIRALWITIRNLLKWGYRFRGFGPPPPYIPI